MAIFKILALDGGGIRGAFTAAFLAELERRTGCRLARCFDLFAGTSTGGIIAAALAMGEPAERVESLYRERGAKIFTRMPSARLSWGRRALLWALKKKFPELDRDWLFQPKYNAVELSAALEQFFGHRTLDQMQQRVVIPSVDLVHGQTVVFKTPHLPGLVRDRELRAVDVIRATTAAPTYFPHAVIRSGTAYVDGGLWANNPSVVAYAEAMQIARRCQRAGMDPHFVHDDIRMLSIGTGHAPYFVQPPVNKDGLMFWASKIFEVMGAAQAQGTHFQTSYLLPPEQLQRVDFPIPDRSWKLDCVEYVEQLIHIGREQAMRCLAELQPMFLSGEAVPYTPFPVMSAAAPKPDESPVGARVA